MSLWRHFFDGFAEGVLTVAAHQRTLGNAGCERGRIDRLCRELGWSVDEREGSVIHLHFNDPAFGIRKVRISGGDDSLVTFSAWSFAALPERSVPSEVLGYLVTRNINGSGIGMWGVYIDDNAQASFHIMYQALGVGLDANALKYICESLGAEAVDFDDKMRQARLLR